MNYYNEIEPYAAQWLRNLIEDGLIPRGDVDERSIEDVQPSVKNGLCHSHLSRLKRYGNPLAVKVKTASGWVLDTSGLPVRSRRSRKAKEPA